MTGSATAEQVTITGPSDEKPEWMVKVPWWLQDDAPHDDWRSDYETALVVESLESGEVTIADGLPNVYDLHHDGLLTITEHDFRRVVVMHPGGGYHIEKEVVSVEEADAAVEAYNAELAPGEPKAESIDYIEAWRRAERRNIVSGKLSMAVRI